MFASQRAPRMLLGTGLSQDSASTQQLLSTFGEIACFHPPHLAAVNDHRQAQDRLQAGHGRPPFRRAETGCPQAARESMAKPVIPPKDAPAGGLTIGQDGV